MAERLWSGAGCADSPHFRFVKHTDSGVALYRKVGDDRVELDDDAGGATYIIKRAGPAQREEPKMANLSETITKALMPDAGDTAKEAADKALVRKQLEVGAVTAEQVAADMILRARADTIMKRDKCSPEAGYVRAMEDDPALAATAAGW